VGSSSRSPNNTLDVRTPARPARPSTGGRPQHDADPFHRFHAPTSSTDARTDNAVRSRASPPWCGCRVRRGIGYAHRYTLGFAWAGARQFAGRSPADCDGRTRWPTAMAPRVPMGASACAPSDLWTPAGRPARQRVAAPAGRRAGPDRSERAAFTAITDEAGGLAPRRRLLEGQVPAAHGHGRIPRTRPLDTASGGEESETLSTRRRRPKAGQKARPRRCINRVKRTTRRGRSTPPRAHAIRAIGTDIQAWF
jgi:hypothetical protein